MIIITNKKKNNWLYVKQNFPIIHLLGGLYLVRCWQKQTVKISPWILIYVKRGVDE